MSKSQVALVTEVCEVGKKHAMLAIEVCPFKFTKQVKTEVHGVDDTSKHTNSSDVFYVGTQ